MVQVIGFHSFTKIGMQFGIDEVVGSYTPFLWKYSVMCIDFNAFEKYFGR